MNAKTLKQALKYMFDIKVTPLIIGRNGIGKTQSLRQYAKENDLEYIEINLGELESMGDLLGLMKIEEGKSTFMKPSWWPAEGSRGVLVLDEITRAPSHIRQGTLRLLYERRLHDYKLPEGWMTAATGNPDTDDFVTVSFDDKAYFDRTCFIKFEPTQDEFMEYARSKKMDPRLYMFLADNPKYLEYDAKDFDNPALPSRRTNLEFVDPLIKATPPRDVMFGILSGLCGVAYAASLLKYLDSPFNMISSELVALDYNKVRSEITKQKVGVAYLGLLTDNLLDYLKEGKEYKQESVEQFLLDLPKDLAFNFCQVIYLIPELKSIFDNSERLYQHFLSDERIKTLKKYGHTA